jgi:hypothetical protein
MANGDAEAQALNLDDPDRLPWLEPADEVFFEEEGVSLGRIIGLVLIGLVLLGVIVGGGYWLKHRSDGSVEDAKLIPAPGGDYKEPAKGNGKAFEGEGDTSYAASEGVETNGMVDASRMPEAPMAGVSPGSIAKEEAVHKDAANAAKPSNKVTAPVKDETHEKAATSWSANTDAGAGGAMIQLGANGNEAYAREAWTKLSKRFDYLAALTSTIQKAEVGGATVYRLRASAGSASDAATLCGRLKVAGESCIVVR